MNLSLSQSVESTARIVHITRFLTSPNGLMLKGNKSNMNSDSTNDTQKHINRVAEYLDQVGSELLVRIAFHDASKLEEPEKHIFDVVTSKLHGLTYGSEEYEKSLAEMKPALDHHYANNSHHPEHFENGIKDMTLMDLIEMYCDWCAATERHDNGDIGKSIQHNADRFKFGDVLGCIFSNTSRQYSMGKGCEHAHFNPGECRDAISAGLVEFKGAR